jgi:hypothetical protein
VSVPSKLISLSNEDLLKEGADPFALWRVVKEIFDALNNLTIEITPTNAGHVEIDEGNFKLVLKVVTQADAPNVIPGYAPAGSSVGDASGSPMDTGGNILAGADGAST